MNMPYDIARCGGVKIEAEGADGWYWRNGCADCRRREPGRLDGWQNYISPPEIIDVECKYRIKPEVSNG